MAIKARETITVSKERDISAVWRFYRIAASTSTPSQPTEAQGKAYVTNKTVPSGWSISEPAYDGTSTNSLYTCDLTSFTDGGVSWSVVSKSSSYEAAKQAYNEAQNAKKTATNFMSADELGVMVADMRNGSGQSPSNPSGRNVLIGSDSVEIRDGSEVLARFGEEVKIGQDGGNQMRISSEKLELETGDGITMVDVDSEERTAAVGASDLAHMTFDGYKTHIESAVENSRAFEAYTNPGQGTQTYEQTLVNWSTNNTIPMLQIYNNGATIKASGEVSSIVSANAVIKIIFSSGSVIDRNEEIDVTYSNGYFKVTEKQEAFGINPMAAELCKGTITVKYKAGDGSAHSVAFSNGNMQVDWNGIPAFKNPSGSFDTVFNLLYPVGSIYMSVKNTSPATLFGGTWEQIKDRFLLAAGSSYAAGATGGEATHKLTVAEMPSHTHVQNQHRHSMGAIWSDGTGSDSRYVMESKRGTQTRYTAYSTPTNQNTGGGGAHNNMPPYLAVYVWKRTS